MIPIVLNFRSAEMAAAALKILPPDLWASEPCRAERSASHPWSLILGVPECLCIDGIGIPDDSVFAAIQRLVISTGAHWIDELLPLATCRYSCGHHRYPPRWSMGSLGALRTSAW